MDKITIIFSRVGIEEIENVVIYISLREHIAFIPSILRIVVRVFHIQNLTSIDIPRRIQRVEFIKNLKSINVYHTGITVNTGR